MPLNEESYKSKQQCFAAAKDQAEISKCQAYWNKQDGDKGTNPNLAVKNKTQAANRNPRGVTMPGKSLKDKYA